MSSKWLLILSLLILVFFTVNLTRAIINRQDLLSDINVLQEEIDGLESRSQELVSLIEYFKTIDFVETEARTKLNLKKPGETIIIVPEEEMAESEAGNKSAESILITAEVKDINNIHRWWNYFFGIN